MINHNLSLTCHLYRFYFAIVVLSIMEANLIEPVSAPPPPPQPTIYSASGQPIPCLDTSPSDPSPNQLTTQKVNVLNPINMEEDRPVSLGHLYTQCREARLTAQTVQVTTVDRLSDSTVYATYSIPHARVGGFEEGDDGVLRTFHGSRNVAVGGGGQSMSSSFDPANLSCIMCSGEHDVIQTDRPTVICLTDQNFPSNLCGDKDNCIGVVRFEDASLEDLYEIFCEIFGRVGLPPGTVVLIGSGSYLYRVGASAYAADWVRLLSSMATKFSGLNICPLVPVLTCDIEGSMARDICQIAIWFAQVYANNVCGLPEVWSYLVKTVDGLVKGGNPLDTPETVKLSMPKDLTGANPMTYIFRFNSSCPALLSAMDRKAIIEILRVLICTLVKTLSVKAVPEAILEREKTGAGTKQVKYLAVVGASVMHHILPYLASSGLTVIDLTRPGWVPTEAGIASLREAIKTVPLESTVFVADLLSNTTVRFAQFDGGTALPVKLGGGYHLPGDIKVADEATIKKVVDSVAGILKDMGMADKILIPPLPRYLNAPCCSSTGHCTNRGEAGFGEALLGDLTKARAVLKSSVERNKVTKYRVLDGIGSIAGHNPDGPARPGNREILGSILPVFARDGVHLNEVGLQNLSNAILRQIKLLLCAGPISVPGSSAGKHYWRGFVSPNGSATRQPSRTGVTGRQLTRGHPYGRRPAPYQKKKD